MAEEPGIPTAPAAPPQIITIPQDGFNLIVDEQLAPDYVVVKQTRPAHNWFAGTFSNLPTDREVTIGLSMQGNGGGINIGNVAKWKGLRPVLTYADPTKYESYEWFIKDDNGVWISGDPFKKGKEKLLEQVRSLISLSYRRKSQRNFYPEMANIGRHGVR